MKFGWLKSIGKGIGKGFVKAFTVPNTPKKGSRPVILNYRGSTGTEESPLTNYSGSMDVVRRYGSENVKLVYGAHDAGRYQTMKKVADNDNSYIERIAKVQAKGGRTVKVDDDGIVRTLRNADYRPAGARSVETLVQGDDVYQVYDSQARDELGNKISYVVHAKDVSKMRIEDRNDKLVAYYNEIVLTREGARLAIRSLQNREYFEQKKKQLDAISGLKDYTMEGRQFYVQVQKDGTVRRFSKNNVDILRNLTNHYLSSGNYFTAGNSFRPLSKEEIKKLLAEGSTKAQPKGKEKSRKEEPEVVGAAV